MNLLSFVGGAAKQFVSSAERAEEDAKEMAKASFNGLYKRYEENAEANRELTNKMKAEKQYIETMWQNATPEQVNELLANPVALDAIKKTKNPSSVDLNNYIRVIKGNESKATGAERAAILPEVMEKVKSSIESTGSPVGALFRDMGKQRMESDMEKYARGMGMTLEQLRSSEKAARPAGSAAFNMSVLQEPKDFKELKDKAQVDLITAQESNDPKAINAATERVARINTIESIGKLEKKTEQQIQSDLVTEIQEKQKTGDKQGAATATALLRQRQALMKAPGSEGKTDADKISQANLIQTATRTRATTIEQELPPGQLITTTDAQGNVTMTLRDLSQGDLFRRGDAIAANAIIKEMSRPDGLPRSEMHKNAMMSAGIRFDDAGKAIRPVIPELPSKRTPTPAAAPAAAPVRGGPTPATPAPAARPTTAPATTNVAQARADANAAIAQGADRAAVAERFKKTTGQEL
jgi:hypothetical protein